MSEIFEGVLVKADARRLEAETIAEQRWPLVVAGLGSGLTIAYRDDPRETAAFSPGMDDLASAISRAVGAALVVRYDSRIGHRSANLYKEGVMERGFGEADETYYLLDERGYPRTDSEKLRADQLDEDEEYETAQNAIQLGLAALGADDWEALYDLMTG